jgi:hypothetical protein
MERIRKSASPDFVCRRKLRPQRLAIHPHTRFVRRASSSLGRMSARQVPSASCNRPRPRKFPGGISSHLYCSVITSRTVNRHYDYRMRLRPAKPLAITHTLAKQRKAPVVPIESRITILRRQKVILDMAPAEIDGITVERLNEQVNRNWSQFPADFIFQLKPGEFAVLRLQFATSKKGRGGRRSLPYAFTEHGAIMAATVLNFRKGRSQERFWGARLCSLYLRCWPQIKNSRARSKS